jgi:DNA invertase Pin-like site-specific DNA recombinase
VTRCVLYARISVTKEESVSVDRQLDAGRKLAELRGWEIIGEFVDDGVSATANRPEDREGWKALLRAGRFDAVVIWKVDRLARKVLDFLHVDEVLQKRGAGLVAVEDPIDMTTPMGRAFATILAVFGEMEAAAIASRVKAARKHLIKEGRFTGGSLPYGYMSAPRPEGAGRIVVHDPERIEWLRQAIRWALDGMSANGIATRLTSEGAPAPAGNRNPDAYVFSRQMVGGLLRSPRIAGMTPHNPGRGKQGKTIDPWSVVRHESGDPVVDEDLAVVDLDRFRALLDALDNSDHPAAVKAAERRQSSPLLAKVARCDECEVWMCRGSNQGRPTLYCPRCRQTIGRTYLDAYLVERLLAERGAEPLGTASVRVKWAGSEGDDSARREVLRSQIDSLRIRRGVVGRTFDEDRVLLTWCDSIEIREAA